MKYNLTWKVSKTVPTACPDYTLDPYTGEYPSFHCAVYHCTTVTEEKHRGFETKKEALAFASGAPSSCNSFALNGKEIRDTRPKTDNLTITYSGLVGDGTTTIMSGTNLLNVLPSPEARD